MTAFSLIMSFLVLGASANQKQDIWPFKSVTAGEVAATDGPLVEQANLVRPSTFFTLFLLQTSSTLFHREQNPETLVALQLTNDSNKGRPTRRSNWDHQQVDYQWGLGHIKPPFRGSDCGTDNAVPYDVMVTGGPWNEGDGWTPCVLWTHPSHPRANGFSTTSASSRTKTFAEWLNFCGDSGQGHCARMTCGWFGICILNENGTKTGYALQKEAVGNPWDAENCPSCPECGETCWANSAFSKCTANRQGTYDDVMAQDTMQKRYETYLEVTSNAEGCTKLPHHPWDKENCPSCPECGGTCWANSAFSYCTANRQGAYDEVMAEPSMQLRYEKYLNVTSKTKGCTTPKKEPCTIDLPDGVIFGGFGACPNGVIPFGEKCEVIHCPTGLVKAHESWKVSVEVNSFGYRWSYPGLVMCQEEGEHFSLECVSKWTQTFPWTLAYPADDPSDTREIMCSNIQCSVPTDRPGTGEKYHGSGCKDLCLSNKETCNAVRWTKSGSHCCEQFCDDLKNPTTYAGTNTDWVSVLLTGCTTTFTGTLNTPWFDPFKHLVAVKITPTKYVLYKHVPGWIYLGFIDHLGEYMVGRYMSDYLCPKASDGSYKVDDDCIKDVHQQGGDYHFSVDDVTCIS